MDLKMLSLGERIAAASGAALFVFTFVSWRGDEHAWERFDVLDILLAILALAAVALPLIHAAGVELPLRPSNRTILIRIGAVTLTFILAYFVEELGGAQVGMWLALLCAVALLYGASTIPDDGSSSRRRERPRAPRAHENFGEPPPGMESWRTTGLGDEGGVGDGAAYDGTAGGELPEPGELGAEERSPERERGRRTAGFDEPFTGAEPLGDEPFGDREATRTQVRRPRGGPEVPPASER